MEYCNDITRHSAYIKRRTDILSDYLNSCPDRLQALGIVIHSILNGRNHASLDSDEAEKAVQELNSLLEIWDIHKDGDLAGYLYQHLENPERLKEKGQFFTPHHIVTYLVEQSIPESINIETVQILDPACGSGQFLIASFRRLVQIYEKNGVPFHEAA